MRNAANRIMQIMALIKKSIKNSSKKEVKKNLRAPTINPRIIINKKLISLNLKS